MLKFTASECLILQFYFIAGFVHSDSCPPKEKQSPDKLKMDTAFLNISTDLSQPIEISGISSNCYKVGEHISDVINLSKRICQP